jgi:hypothetical protein
MLTLGSTPSVSRRIRLPSSRRQQVSAAPRRVLGTAPCRPFGCTPSPCKLGRRTASRAKEPIPSCAARGIRTEQGRAERFHQPPALLPPNAPPLDARLAAAAESLRAGTTRLCLTPDRGVIDYTRDAEGALPWFELRVTAKGRRTFTVAYIGRRQPGVRLGSRPAASLAEARARARRILAEVTHGDDPAAEGHRARRAADLAALANRFIDDRERNLAPSTLKEHRRILKAEIAGSTFGRVSAERLTRADFVVSSRPSRVGPLL